MRTENLENVMTETEKLVLAAIQYGMAATRNPYADTAKRAGLTTEQVLGTLRHRQHPRQAVQ